MNILPEIESETIQIPSELMAVDGSNPILKIRAVDKKLPTAIAFFDIDKTLAHLDILYRDAISMIFPNEDKDELIKTFIGGFKLGNSYREFDRMHCIYVEGKSEWKDAEKYHEERLEPFKELIDVPGSEFHTRSAYYLKQYGECAAKIADGIYKTNPEIFMEAEIAPLYALLDMYQLNGVLMFGFTANASEFVAKLAMYLGLSNYFLSIATDETMAGGGKEIAIRKLLDKVEERGLIIPKEQLIFVGDSIRGDIGSGALFCKNNLGYAGMGILVVDDMDMLLQIRHLINTNESIHDIVSTLPTSAFVVNSVPKDTNGHFSLLDRGLDKFLFRL